MDKTAVKRRVKSALLAHLGGLVAALGFAVGAHAAPPRGHSPRAVPEEIVLRGTDSEGNELALRVPVNILMPRLGELARPGELARLGGLAQLQEPGNNAGINLNQIGGGSVSSALYDSGNTALKVNCIVGCSAAGSFTDNSAFTTGSTSVTNVSGLFNDTATNLTSGNAGAIRATTDRMLFVNIGKIGGTVPALTGSSLNVNCTGGCSSSAGFTDNSAFTAGTTTETNVGGVFNDGLTALTSGNAAAARITPNRGVHVNLRNNSGTEIATSANPLRIDPTGTTTQPVSGTVTANAGTGQFNVICTAANCPMNVAQFGGSAVVTGTGASGAGIPRVTISNDSSLAANQSVNLAQVGGTNTVNGGTAGTLGVGGNLSSNGAAAGTNRVGTLDGIAQTSYNNGTAATQGRDVAPNVGTDGLLWTAALPAIRPASFVASKKFAASSTTDNAVMPGNASNTVLLTAIKVTCTQTTAGNISVEILKRSAADTAGTSAAMTAVPDDSNYSAAVSAPLSYTGTGPSVGAAVGDVDNAQIGCMAAATATPNDIYILNRRQKPIVLRGVAQQVAVNTGNAAISGGNLTVTFEWIETATITP
jgi:hypothetical protein